MELVADSLNGLRGIMLAYGCSAVSTRPTVATVTPAVSNIPRCISISAVANAQSTITFSYGYLGVKVVTSI